jgi:hypothetical protein
MIEGEGKRDHFRRFVLLPVAQHFTMG